MDVGRLRTWIAPALLLGGLSGCASIIGPTTATSFMKQVETSADPNVRYKAYQSLARDQVYDDREQKTRAAGLLLTKLDPRLEPSASRAVICRTLGELGEPVARDAMVRLCHDGDPLIRAEAYHALGKVGKLEDSTVLMQAMALDYDDHCKTAAVEALGSLKEVDPRTEGFLVRALDSDDPRIRYASLRSLRKISRKDLGAKAEPWRAYVLAKYGEKIDPPNLAAAPAPGSLDRSASMASLPPGSLPASAAPGTPWSRSSDTDEFDMPYLASKPAAPVQQAPGQTPLPAPPAAGPKGVFSKILGY